MPWPASGQASVRLGGVFHRNSSLTEVKNVAAIRARDARQIAAEATYASQKGRRMNLYTRPGADLSRIQGLIDNGAISSVPTIPGVGSNGFRVLTSGESALSGSLIGGLTNSLK